VRAARIVDAPTAKIAAAIAPRRMPALAGWPDAGRGQSSRAKALPHVRNSRAGRFTRGVLSAAAVAGRARRGLSRAVVAEGLAAGDGAEWREAGQPKV